MKKRIVFPVFLIIILGILLVSSATLNTEQKQERVEDGYDCLKEKVGSNCASSNSNAAAFNLLALSHDSSYKSKCTKALLNKKSGTSEKTCWPETSSAGCNLKSTALASIALKSVGESKAAYTNWILSKKKISTELDWYLEIESNSDTIECTISEDSQPKQTFYIGSDKRITSASSASGCFTPAVGNYFLQISKTESCYAKNFTISCNDSFISTLFYLKDNIFYISSETHQGSLSQSTDEKISSYCLVSSGSNCDYEGTLWGALALAVSRKEYYDLVPYLIVAKDENTKYLPSAFLYMLTGSTDFLNEFTIGESKPKSTGTEIGAWKVSATNKALYDTSIALLALQGVDSESSQKTNALNYLFNIQDMSSDTKGCFNAGNTVEDTAFALFSAWPRTSLSFDCTSDCSQKTCGDDGCGGSCGSCSSGKHCDNNECLDGAECLDECTDNEIGQTKCFGKVLKVCGEFDSDSCNDYGNASTCSVACRSGECSNVALESCVSKGFYCVAPGECTLSNIKSDTDFFCSPVTDVCCAVDASLESCSDKLGKKCALDETCTGIEERALDAEKCCLGACKKADTETTECEENNFKCEISCDPETQETMLSYECNSGFVCCGEKDTPSQGSSSWFWIILLIILIILVILAIIYRDQLKIWFFKLKSNFKSSGGPKPTSRPMPPSMPQPRFSPNYPRPIQPRMPSPQRQSQRPSLRPQPKQTNQQNPRGEKDKDFEDTMKKLRDMSK
ncbi:MAG: hypothetical protein ACP5OG_03550 [Candidatus Nanoarchaeia archaeon]